MDEAKRKALTEGLSTISGRIAAEMRERMLGERDVRARAEQLHADERVGEDFEVWTDLLSRRAAVMWVLKSVYVRVLEDRKLITPRRIVDATSPQLFGKLAPDLGDTAYLRWVYRDLAQPDGGLPELFALSAAELVWPSDALSRELLDFWRQRDPDTGELVYRFDHERFDGRLMGDLYQDLDPVVKDRFALLQTPDFILEFILDETLTPAIEEFGVDEVRLLDPACGSGHFLLEAFRRLVAAMREAHPERSVEEIVPDVLSRVVGIDLNDYACGLARARLVMTALETLGSDDLGDASDLHPQVFWADGLEQIERDEMQQTSLALGEDVVEKPRAMLTQPEVRARLRPILKAGFHAIVGNPPYITEKDKARKAYHREKIGKRRRYESASGKYSLGAVFTERMFQLCVKGGFLGEITADSFMKREFGRGLIETVLPRVCLTAVVDTSGAFIPGHGTPTVILFGRNETSPPEHSVLVVGGKRGEPGKPEEPANGHVWLSIQAGFGAEGHEDEYTSTARVDGSSLLEHPWSIAGGGATDLTEALQDNPALGFLCDSVGITSFTLEDDAYIRPSRAWARFGARLGWTRRMVEGDAVRDWSVDEGDQVFFPYSEDLSPVSPSEEDRLRLMWSWRTNLANNILFGGKTKVEGGLNWYEFGRLTTSKLRVPLSITFGEVSTHNHFALDRGGKVFKQTAPVIKLPADASEEDHLVLLAQLNSSTACFWLKQVCQSKGIGGRGAAGVNPEAWEMFFQYGGTKLQAFPLARTADQRLVDYATALDGLARERQEDDAASVLARAADGSAALLAALEKHRDRDFERLCRMVGLQEELDWYCYGLYGVDEDAPDSECREPNDVPPLTPGQRCFELSEARREAEEGHSREEGKTGWFDRHGWEPVTELSAVPDEWRAVTEARLARTAESRELGLLEQPTYKRRWYRPDYQKEEREAMALWLADRVEREAETRTEPFTVRSIASALQPDPAVEAVATLYAGAGFDLDQVVAQILDEEAVPNLKSHVFKKKGLVKRAAWERMWELQHAEDAWDAKKKAHDDAIAAGVDPHEAPPLPEGRRPEPEVPPKYGTGDYLRPTYWKQRGKLDVPKERFIAYTEAPGELTENGEQPLYGWAGWDHLRRAQVLLALDEQAEDAGVDLKDRYGLLWGVQFLLPYVRWGDDKAQSAASEFAAILRDLVGDTGITDAMLAEWAKAHPPPKGRPKAKKPKTTKTARKKKS